MRIASLSALTGCEVYAKCEFLNPGGSSKDRVALQIVNEAAATGSLQPGGYLVEGSSGSTGISLALMARAKGYKAWIVMPDDQAVEKALLLRSFGATVQLVKPASIVSPEHYVNVARRVAKKITEGREDDLRASLLGNEAPDARPHSSTRTSGPIESAAVTAHASAVARDLAHSTEDELRASGGAPSEGMAYETKPASVLERNGGPAKLAADDASKALRGDQQAHSPTAIFCDQFETLSNYRAHLSTTGPEIWAQTEGKIDAFVMGAGTGGTLAGVGAALKARKPSCQLYLVDPQGSSLYNRVAHGVAFAPQQAERTLRRHRYDTIVEGVGIDRVTANFAEALPLLDGAFQCSDSEAVAMARHLVQHDGIFVGSSSALNCVGAVKLARKLGPGHTVVTLLCDSGLRHLSRFWNDEHLTKLGLLPVDRTVAASLGLSI